MNHRMLPPNGAAASTTVNGRTYSCAANGYVDVPDFDALVLESNGWTIAANGGVGTTAQRPTNPKKNDTFHDSTLGYNIKFNGKGWVNPTSGAAV